MYGVLLYSRLHSNLPLCPPSQSPPHPAGPTPDLQSQLRPFQGLAPHDLQRQLQQLNINQHSGGDTSPERQESPTQGHLSGKVSPNSGNNSRKSSFGGAAPAPQPMMGQFLGTHQPILGSGGSGTRGGVAQPTPMASILSVSVSHACHVTDIQYSSLNQVLLVSHANTLLSSSPPSPPLPSPPPLSSPPLPSPSLSCH